MTELTHRDSVAAFPLGGIGTGNVSVGARGELRDWEIANSPNKGGWLPFTFFAIHAKPEGGAPVTRVLEAEFQPPFEGSSGFQIGRSAGLPRLARTRVTGEYPLLTIAFDDDELPVDVTLTAFTPLVPLDTDESGIPAAILRYSVTNPGPLPMTVSIAGSMCSPIGMVSDGEGSAPRFVGRPSVAYRDDGHQRGLVFGTDLPEQHVRYGSAALVTTAVDVTATAPWAVSDWWDGAELFWSDFSSDGLLDDVHETSHVAGTSTLRIGSLSVTREITPGASEDFEFVLGWHTPNRVRAWQGNCGLPNTHEHETVRNHYATRFSGAWEIASHLLTHLPQLEESTRDFHRLMFASTVPPEVVDAVTATLVALRSTTCFRLDDGTPDGLFAAWEGSFDRAGSCEGTCTHVWNYAQSVAFLFPDLERSARRTEFLHETAEDGRQNFRANSVFGGEPLVFHPAVDGQLGSVARLYREWRFSGDDEFLRELWPGARRALEYAFTVWDTNGDDVLDSRQHNTYDIEFYGENSMSGSVFYAALRAAAVMAQHLGEDALAQRYSRAAERGAERMDELLYNGEYYIQSIDDVDEHRYQYGQGCLSDQLLGQTIAHLLGLGHVLPADHVRSAVSAVYRHNFAPSLRGRGGVQRTYALGDEAGLLLCTWPNGGRPRIPFVYSDEVWSGVEYQVATLLAYEGLLDESLRLVGAVRDRHDGRRRNPWNEVECGNHYARSMASWGVLLALTGTQWDAPSGVLRLSPTAAVFDSGTACYFFSTAEGWGRVRFDDSGVELEVVSGRLTAREVIAHHPTLGTLVRDEVTLHEGQSISL